MNTTDELLMAYADGELDVETRDRIAREIATDPALAQKVELHRRLRSRLHEAFDPVLAEPVPERLRAAAQKQPEESSILDLTRARHDRATSTSGRRFTAPNWFAMAASVVVGILIGVLVALSRNDSAPAESGMFADRTLSRALTEQLAGHPAPNDAAIHVGVSFEAKSGELCRTFTTRHAAGFACHEMQADDRWQIRMLVPSDSAHGQYRRAASAIPATVLDEVGREIRGEPFDAEREARAAANGWRK
jgi:anti-sigma-K factor RskA